MTSNNDDDDDKRHVHNINEYCKTWLIGDYTKLKTGWKSQQWGQIYSISINKNKK